MRIESHSFSGGFCVNCEAEWGSSEHLDNPIACPALRPPRHVVLFIVGEPGIGKSTLTRSLLGDPVKRVLVPNPKWTLGYNICAAGHFPIVPTNTDGTDRIGYNQIQQTIDYWGMHLQNIPYTIIEGDRLSIETARIQFKTYGNKHRVLCLLLKGSKGAERRRNRRTNQNTTWIKGRVTKSDRFYSLFPDRDRVIIDADNGPNKIRIQTKHVLWCK